MTDLEAFLLVEGHTWREYSNDPAVKAAADEYVTEVQAER